jgi:hypothetical protein
MTSAVLDDFDLDLRIDDAAAEPNKYPGFTQTSCECTKKSICCG